MTPQAKTKEEARRQIGYIEDKIKENAEMFKSYGFDKKTIKMLSEGDRGYIELLKERWEL